MRITDEQKKVKGKEYSDTYNHIRESEVKEGDRVVENHGKPKLETNFHPREFEVIRKSGEEVAIRDDTGVTLRRNEAHTNKLPETSKAKDDLETWAN